MAAADASPMEIEWLEATGVKGWQGGAVEQSTVRELASEREYGGNNAEEVEKRDLLRGKTQGYRAW